MSFQSDLRRMVSPRSVGGQFALVFVVATLLGGIAPGLGANLALSGQAVLSDYKLWQLVTHAFIAPLTPLGLIFGVMVSLSAGQQLEAAWGTRRSWAFLLSVGLGTGVGLTLASLVFPVVGLVPYASGWATLTAMWVAQGLLLGPGRANFWGLPVSGYVLALIGALFPVINAITGGWLVELNSFLAIALTAGFVLGKVRLPALVNPWTQFRSWQLERELKKRSSHLKSIDGGRNMGGGSDRFLQ